MDKRWSSSLIRILLIGLFFASGYLLLLFSLWRVQIEKGEEHRQRISKQSVRRIRIPPVRGRIIASDGRIVADNQPTYDVVLHLEEMRQPGTRSRTVAFIMEAMRRIAVAVGRKNENTIDRVNNHINYRPGLPYVVFTDLNPKELARLAELPLPPKGMEITVVPRRVYADGEAFSHVIGYTAPEDPQRADDRDDFFYYLPDVVGRQGLEKVYDEIIDAPVAIRGLQGHPGGSLVRVDHRGYVFETISTENAAHGNDILITIDSRAQKIAYDLMRDKVGALVLLDADSGAVLAMVSTPSFDPNLLSGGMSRSVWSALLHDKRLPMFNRATMGAYTPGSIVKPLVALAMLENNGDVSPVVCDGGTSIGNARVKCTGWRRGGHGQVDLVEAITVSCNDFFIEHGMKLGLTPIQTMMRKAGIGAKTGFCLPEQQGMLPTVENKMRLFRNKWNIYDTGLLSIGQGVILVTPLQIATYIAALANGGTLWRPFLLREVRDFNGNVLFINHPQAIGDLNASPEHLKLVRQGMRQVVVAANGSGRKGATAKIELYGKTGTGEVGPRDHRYNNTWFVCFGEKDGRRYAMTVFVDHGISGGSSCAPVASEFFERWLP